MSYSYTVVVGHTDKIRIARYGRTVRFHDGRENEVVGITCDNAQQLREVLEAAIRKLDEYVAEH